MVSIPDIDLLRFQEGLRLQKSATGITQVFDPFRKVFVTASPEEIVRQLWAQYFLEELKVNKKLIAVERAFVLNGLTCRFDLVIFGRSTLPILLAEFKAPGIRIHQPVFDQIARYNMELDVPYSLISNGTAHFCFSVDHDTRSFNWLERIPVGKHFKVP